MFEAKCPNCGSTSLNLYSTEIVTLEETGIIFVKVCVKIAISQWE